MISSGSSPVASHSSMAPRGLRGFRADIRALQDNFFMSSTTRQVTRVL